jgi:uncharacterized short protein YbdD (DUF466 family)
MLFDIVIPIGPSDVKNIHIQLSFTMKNVVGYNNIYLVISPRLLYENETLREMLKNPRIKIVDEGLFPFTKEDVKTYHGQTNRLGWYFQQLLKLYAGKVIPGILDKYLVIDSDVYFLKPINFIDDTDVNNIICLYGYGDEYHPNYFGHMNRMHPSLCRMIHDKSGICHHMMFDKNYVEKMMNLCSSYHNGQEFWRFFLAYVDMVSYHHSGASEYEMYFNFMLKHHPEKIRLRYLKWKNEEKYKSIINGEIPNDYDYDYISIVWFAKD